MGLFAYKMYWTVPSSDTGDTERADRKAPSPVAEAAQAAGIRTIRMQGELTKSLILFEPSGEDERLASLRDRLAGIVAEEKATGNLVKAGVYLRRLDEGSWTGVNPEEGFHPASLVKVPVLITYLAASEEQPGLLDKKLVYTTPGTPVPSQTFTTGEQLKPGKSYTVRELLFAMAARSDNYATLLLLQHLELKRFKKLFTDLGMQPPPENDLNFKISPADYSRFFRVLYNTTYLSRHNSEYALSILTRSSFREGFVQGLPKKVRVARKFGEFNHGANKELHEAGIIYDAHGPYLLVLMTEGKGVAPLTHLMERMARTVHETLEANHS